MPFFDVLDVGDPLVGRSGHGLLIGIIDEDAEKA